MIRIKSQKGSALLVTVCILLALLMASFSGLGAYSKHLSREIVGQDVRRTQGYYAALAGLRYAAMVLQRPVTFTNGTYTVTGTELGGGVDLYADISVDRANLTITITQITSGDDAGQFQIDSTYTY